jgi:hypothetical protein
MRDNYAHYGHIYMSIKVKWAIRILRNVKGVEAEDFII